MCKIEPNLMLILLGILVKVQWVELGGTDFLSIYSLQPGFEKGPKRLSVLSFRVNLEKTINIDRDHLIW